MKAILKFLFRRTIRRIEAEAVFESDSKTRLVLKVNERSVVDNTVAGLRHVNKLHGDDPNVIRFTFRTRRNNPFALFQPPI
jgi:hypothetical protein